MTGGMTVWTGAGFGAETHPAATSAKITATIMRLLGPDFFKLPPFHFRKIR